jgi:hypothetical protein
VIGSVVIAPAGCVIRGVILERNIVMTPRNMNPDWTSEFGDKVDKVLRMNPKLDAGTPRPCPAGQTPDRTGFR